jgi:hypothetical protein
MVRMSETPVNVSEPKTCSITALDYTRPRPRVDRKKGQATTTDSDYRKYPARPNRNDTKDKKMIQPGRPKTNHRAHYFDEGI